MSASKQKHHLPAQFLLRKRGRQPPRIHVYRILADKSKAVFSFNSTSCACSTHELVIQFLHSLSHLALGPDTHARPTGGTGPIMICRQVTVSLWFTQATGPHQTELLPPPSLQPLPPSPACCWLITGRTVSPSKAAILQADLALTAELSDCN